MPAIYIAGNRTMNALRGKTALVTCASYGIGRASALALAAAGAQVLVHHNSAGEKADGVVRAIRSAGGHAEKLAEDLATPDGPQRLARRTRAIIGARLDVLVANAGNPQNASSEDLTVDQFDALIALNVRAPFFLVQQLMPAMCKGSNVIVVSPPAAGAMQKPQTVREAMGSSSVHAASKGALDTLVKHFASTLGARGVRVNAIAPCKTGSNATGVTRSDAVRDAFPGMQVSTRLVQPNDIGAAIVFLASDAARWITGDTLYVDGEVKF
jgi:3-oxoacyl-[acyl-carrier protein] reductase